MFFMINVELINLVTTRLVQERKEVDYKLKKMVTDSNGDNPIENIINLLNDYRHIVGNIQLWETLIDDITTPEKEEGDNNNEKLKD